MYKVGIVGATGYTASELIKILVKHPEVQIAYLGSHSRAGEKVQEAAPELKSIIDRQLESYDQLNQKELDLVFLALPHGVAMEQVKNIWEQTGIKIVDLSADFRFKQLESYEKHYKPHIIPELLQEAVYGLPELTSRKMITSARLLANPGCYVTAATLGLAPIIETGEYQSGSIIIDAKSGYSGAGRAFAEEFQKEKRERFKGYKVAEHRHQPEIEQNISEKVVFVPHLLPVFRGILTTIYLDLKQDSELSAEKIGEIYQQKYGNEPFVEIVDQPPDISQVNGTNRCLIWYKYLAEEKKMIIITAIDNLIKGASGQAVQNMNLMLGLEETTGLI